MSDLMLLMLAQMGGFPFKGILLAVIEIFAIWFFVWLIAYWAMSQIPSPAAPFNMLIVVLRVIIVVIAAIWTVLILLGLAGMSLG